jgi:hypothetical protein
MEEPKKDDRHRDPTPLETREAVIERIQARREFDLVLNNARAGEHEAIRAIVGAAYPDICEDEYKLDHARFKIDEALEKGAANSWDTYEDALEGTREEYDPNYRRARRSQNSLIIEKMNEGRVSSRSGR